MANHNLANLSFEGQSENDKIVCQKCGWNWYVKDGGNDLYVCHKCGYDNSNFYLKNKEQHSNFVDPNLVLQTSKSVAELGGKIAESRASKQMSKSDVQKEVEIRCGKRRGGTKKKKSAYKSCLDSTLNKLDLDEESLLKFKQEQQQIALKLNQQNKKNTTYIIVGIVAIILGYVAFKKFKK